MDASEGTRKDLFEKGRKMKEFLNNKQKHIPVLSFFTGGGFLDMGFEQAGVSNGVPVPLAREVAKSLHGFFKKGNVI